jgi:hypothetical protein
LIEVGAGGDEPHGASAGVTSPPARPLRLVMQGLGFLALSYGLYRVIGPAAESLTDGLFGLSKGSSLASAVAFFL